MSKFDPRHYTKLMNGNLVQNDLLGITDQIEAEFGDRVKVMYLEQPGEGVAEEPWIICEWVEQTQSWEKIFGVWEMDQRVLDTLRDLDNQGKKAAEVLEKLEKQEADMRAKGQEEYNTWRKEEAIPLIKAAFRTDKTFRFYNENGDLVTLHG